MPPTKNDNDDDKQRSRALRKSCAKSCGTQSK